MLSRGFLESGAYSSTKEGSLRKVKTDSINAMRIAQVFYLQRPVVHIPMKPEVVELQCLCRQADSLNAMYTETQLHFQTILDLLFPSYSQVFSKLHCPSSLFLLSMFPSPKDVLAADREDVLRLLLQNRRGQSWNEEKLRLLFAAAKESLPDSLAYQANVTALRTYIQLLGVYQPSLLSHSFYTGSWVSYSSHHSC